MSNLFNVQKAKAVLANWDLLQSHSGENPRVKIICPNTGAEYTVHGIYSIWYSRFTPCHKIKPDASHTQTHH